MNIDIDTILIAIIILLVTDLLLVVQLILNKTKAKVRVEEANLAVQRYIHRMVAKDNHTIPRRMRDGERSVGHIVILDGDSELTEKSKRQNTSQVKKSIRGLHSAFPLKRIESATNLGLAATDDARVALEAALKKEKSNSVRLYIANSLSDIGNEKSIPILVESLVGAHKWYRDKVNMLISDFGGQLQPYLSFYMSRNEIEIKELLIDFASAYFSSELKQYLFNLIDNMEHDIRELENNCACAKQNTCCCNCLWGRTKLVEGKRLCKFHGIVSNGFHCRRFQILSVNMTPIKNYEQLIYRAAEVAEELYPHDILQNQYLYSNNSNIRNIAVKALGNINSKDSVIKLIEFLNDETVALSALSALSKQISENSAYINMLTDYFMEQKKPAIKEKIAEALSIKIEYFVLRLQTYERQKVAAILQKIICLGKTSAVIGFLNRNRDIEIENALITIIKSSIDEHPELRNVFCTYLKDSVLNKLNFIKCEKPEKTKERKKDAGMVKALYSLLLVVLIIFPLLYLARHFEMLHVWPLLFQLKTYVIDFNYYLAFYSVVINLIYLLLLLLSYVNVSRQSKLWNYKSKKMLFKKRMLPGVSIIAPAFQEEKVIVESVNSLLNLTYPDYELIIVNDGSHDNTLNTLIEYFNLKRIDYPYNKKLDTEPIRGIYKNSSLPKLIVVDKENGGKADSLNAGIMVSNKEYFCCIDSDSLLEEDALLKLASQTLDAETESPALGGNVYPINDCKIEHGHISEVKIPGNTVARFQTIEYIRSFMAGRLGWAYINSLLIISGAFGLFRKERVIAIGGYLTSNEKYKKDTVGEDMELVVRISRMMRESKQKYRINYCYNANCWTEVPEKMGNLKKQRFRWQRGLIEVIHFHNRTLFNPRYGRMGLIAMPYFFLFEMTGPLIEIQGYIMVAAAFFLGILNWQIALLLFISCIMLGVLISIVSLIITEKENVHYGYKDILNLVFYSFIENLGVRQLFSFWRVISYFKMFAKPQGWGTQVRKGFATK